MSLYKLGRLPATRPFGVADLSVYSKGRLPAPPASVNVPSAPGGYPIDGNATYGDCTMAGAAHLVIAWNAEVSGSDPVPDEQTVIETYFTLTGDPTPDDPSSWVAGGQYDTGLNEQNVLETWRKSGLFGEKIDAYAPVDPKSIVDLHRSIAFYGASYLGIACPASAQEQFASGRPWTYVPGSPVEGGHCIVALGYTDQYVKCATWGGIAEVTYPFLAHFLEEAWAVIPHAFVAAGRGPELDLAALAADLDALAA